MGIPIVNWYRDKFEYSNRNLRDIRQDPEKLLHETSAQSTIEGISLRLTTVKQSERAGKHQRSPPGGE